METIECSKCGAIFEKTGAKDKLRRFKDKRFMTTFHCPNCDARVILKNGEEPDTLYLKRLERLKEQARRLGDRQEVNELQDEIDQINREIKMNAGKTRDKKFSMKGKDAYDPTKPKNIAKAKALSVAQGKAASDASSYALSVLYELKSYHNIPSNQGQKLIEKYKGDIDRWEELKITPERSAKQLIQKEGLTGFEKIYVTPDAKDDVNYLGEKVFHTYESWKVACKRANPNVVFEGDRDICEAKPGVGQWDGVTGVIYKTDDEAYDPLDPENIAEEKELAKARGAAASDKKMKDKQEPVQTYKGVDIIYDDIQGNYWAVYNGQVLSIKDIDINRLKRKIDEYLGTTGDSKTKDSLFKGQKVTAIKSERGLREGETYTVLGEEEIMKQIVGEGNTTVYKLQDSSGNVIVIENPEGLFYEVKDAPNNSILDAYDDGYEAAKNGKPISDNPFKDRSRSGWGDLKESWDDGWRNGNKNKDSKTKDKEEENESLKVKIGDIKKNMDAARKMGYDTEPYQKEIDKLETKTKDDNSKNGYYVGITGKARTENPFTKDTETKYPKIEARNKELMAMSASRLYDIAENAGIDMDDFGGANKATLVDSILFTEFNQNDFRRWQMGDSKTKDGDREDLEKRIEKLEIVYNNYPEGPQADAIRKQIESLKLEYLQKFKGFKDKKVRDAVGATLSSKDSKIKDSTDFYTKDPLTKKGEKILAAMKKVYGEEKGEQIFYASKNKGTISGVDGKTKDEEVHLSGSINKDKSVIDRLLKFWEGQYSGQTDKGAIFKFKNESDANGFRKDIKKQVFSVFVDSKTKDQEIKIIIGEDPTSPSPTEQKVEGNDIVYKEYILKQLPESGEFEIYAPGGSIVGHAKALELAKLFVDRIIASKVMYE